MLLTIMRWHPCLQTW